MSPHHKHIFPTKVRDNLTTSETEEKIELFISKTFPLKKEKINEITIKIGHK